MNADLESALQRAENLPTPPDVATEVLELARDENVDLDQVAEVISRDPALTSRLLKVANSPLFGASRQVGSIRESLMVLGLRSVKVMVLGFSLVRKPDRPDGFDYESFWYTALVTAVAARVLTQRLLPRLADEAFVGGLLLDLGVLAAKEAWPEDYDGILAQRRVERGDLCAEERELLGTDHTELGGYLLRSWGLPERLCLLVEHHHDPSGVPEDAPSHTARLARILETAAGLAQSFRCELFEQPDERFAAQLAWIRERLVEEFDAGLDFEELVQDLRGNLREAACTFELRPENPDRLDEIQTAATELLMQVSLGAALDLGQARRAADDEERRAQSLEAANAELRTRATTDALTGLSNRRALEERLQRGELQAPVAVLMCDLDHFKAVNDTHGHAAGDRVLREVGRALGERVPPPGLAARFGGEEFCVLSSGMSFTELEQLAESLRAGVESLVVPLEGGAAIRPTVSLGGVWSEQLPTELGELLQHADALLYESKRSGRNQATLDEHSSCAGARST